MHPNEDWIFVTLDADEENTFPPADEYESQQNWFNTRCIG